MAQEYVRLSRRQAQAVLDLIESISHTAARLADPFDDLSEARTRCQELLAPVRRADAE